MKKIAMFIALMPVIYNGFAQKLDVSKVPVAVKASFQKKYPLIKQVKWEREDGNYEAGFTRDSQSFSAVFKPDGTFTEAEVDIKISELPAVIISYLKEHYKGKRIGEAARITRADGSVNYEAVIQHTDVLFDVNGKFIKEVKD